jgi:hypothetical protein
VSLIKTDENDYQNLDIAASVTSSCFELPLNFKVIQDAAFRKKSGLFYKEYTPFSVRE